MTNFQWRSQSSNLLTECPLCQFQVIFELLSLFISLVFAVNECESFCIAGLNRRATLMLIFDSPSNVYRRGYTGARYHFAAEKVRLCFLDNRMHCCNENRWQTGR